MRGHHAQQCSGSRSQRRSLHGEDSCCDKSLQIIASGHEFAMADIGNGNPLTSAQSFTTGGSLTRVYPFPELGSLRAEPTVSHEPKLSVGSALGAEHLDTHEIGMQKRPRCPEDLFVQRFHPSSCYQLRSDLLNTLCGVKLYGEGLLAPSACLVSGFQLTSSLPQNAFEF